MFEKSIGNFTVVGCNALKFWLSSFGGLIVTGGGKVENGDVCVLIESFNMGLSGNELVLLLSVRRNSLGALKFYAVFYDNVGQI